MIQEIKNKIFSKSIVIFVFVVGFLLRFYQLGGPSLIGDEIITAFRVDHSFLETIALLRHSSFPPLYYAMLNLWVSAFGNSEWSLRFISAFFSGLTVIVIYPLGKELFNRQIGLLSAVVLALSPFAINFAQTAKPYGLFWFLTALSFLFFFRYIKDGADQSLIRYLCVSVLSCYTIYAGYLLLLTQNMMLLILGNRWGWRKWFGGQILIMAVCLPWVLWFLLSSKEPTYGQGGDPYNFMLFLKQAFQWITGAYCLTWSRSLAFGYSFILVLCLFWQEKSNSNLYVSLWAGCLFPILIYGLLNAVVIHERLSVRHIGFIQIPLLLLLCSQVATFRGLTKRIFIALLIMFSVNHTIAYFRYDLRITKSYWKVIATDLLRRLGPATTVVSLLEMKKVEYYFKEASRKFFYIDVRVENFSSELLAGRGIINRNVNSLFVLYKDYKVPKIQIDGFEFDYKIQYENLGFLHYRRVDKMTEDFPQGKLPD